MRNQEETTSSRTKPDTFRWCNCWILIPLTIGAIGLGVIITFSIFSWSIKETMDDTTNGAMEMVLGLVAGDLQPLMVANQSALAIAAMLRPLNNASFSDVVNQVAPKLFMAFEMQPWLPQISYVELNGIAFSYYRAEDAVTRALFSNLSDSWSHPEAHPWYSQMVDPTTGNLVGNATVVTSRPQLPHMTSSYPSLGVGWVRSKDQMMFFTAPVGDTGMVSAAIAVEDVVRAISSIDLHGMRLYYAIGDMKSLQEKHPLGYSLVDVNGKNSGTSPEDEAHMFSSANCTTSVIGAPTFELLGIRSSKHKVACTNFDISGVKLVFQLVLPYKHITRLFQETNIIVIVLVCAMIIIVMITSYLILKVLRQSVAQEVVLHANLIRQKEALQQAERKSMNKSNAFASASHDIRSSLATIAGLIDISRSGSGADMENNLGQMEICTKKLLGILNSILDTSKVESGKMQLEQVEFNLADVLEESVDMINVVGINKRIEVIWDPCDFSVLKCGNVKGDCRRFKQILDNLLGNAMKFTQEGHVILRAWANTPITESSNVPSIFGYPKSNRTFFGWLSKTRKDCIDRHTFNSIQNDPNSIEFYFEVDDTGIGILKENRDAVFENYVQVKEGQEGTGLGLGIVQSFVRLMGGEISVRDKGLGERGTCFGFNVFMKTSETMEDTVVQEGTSSAPALVGMKEFDIRASAFSEDSSFKGAHCVLFVHGNETRRILQDWVESLGVKVWIVPHGELLASTLEKMQLSRASPGRAGSPSFISCETEMCFSSKDVVNQILPVTMKNISSKRGNFDGQSFGVLVVIDLSEGRFDDICVEMQSFRETNRQILCKVVCLADLKTSCGDLKRFKQMCCDHVLRKPVHGSRLYALLRILRDLQGSDTRSSSQADLDSPGPRLRELTKRVTVTSTASEQLATETEAFASKHDVVEDDKPLMGMHFLLVEDSLMLQNIEKRMLCQLGAAVELADDGSAAVGMVKKALEQATISDQGHATSFPYDVILMDCEMPVMNGYEATRCIREEEGCYGMHIPIIALTAHAMDEPLHNTLLAGMDLHLTKPLERARIVEAVRRVRKDQQNKTDVLA